MKKQENLTYNHEKNQLIYRDEDMIEKKELTIILKTQWKIYLRCSNFLRKT